MKAWKTAHLERKCFIFAFNPHSEFQLHITAFPQLFSNFSPQPLLNCKRHQFLLYAKSPHMYLVCSIQVGTY